MEKGSDEIVDTSTAGRVVNQVVTPIPSDAEVGDDITYNEVTEWFEQPTVTYSDDKESDPK